MMRTDVGCCSRLPPLGAGRRGRVRRTRRDRSAGPDRRGDHGRQEGEPAPRPADDRRGRAEARRGRQREDPHALRRGAGRGRPSLRHPGRRGVLAQAQHAARPAVDVHRARHRRRQRVRGAGRLRAHHARRAGAHQERGRAGRRARPRDHPRHREAHHQGHPEEQGRADGRRGNAVGQRGADGARRHRHLRRTSSRTGFGRGEENESDETGIALANTPATRRRASPGSSRRCRSATRRPPRSGACSRRIPR